MPAPHDDPTPYGGQPPDVTQRLNELEALLATVLDAGCQPNDRMYVLRTASSDGEILVSARRALAAYILGNWRPT
jgi:hypothetical protein